jgi:hypothetical protein
MIRAYYIVLLVVATMFAACGSGDTFIGAAIGKRVVANVDDKELLLRDILTDMPEGLTGIDSATFVRMYTDNWVLNQLKLERAKQVLTSQGDIDRLVEDYRQSLIMRQLDQYYVDKELDTDITERQISAHYRMNSSQFVLNHDKVRGVVVRVSDKFRNTSALSDVLRTVSDDGMVELNAFAEKHSLQVTDLSGEWVTFSDFLSYLPTVRTRSYDNVLQKGKVQSMKSDDIVFYFTIVDIARKGSVAPLECVEDDIRRMLYAERRSEIVKRYEMELKLEGVESGRVTVDDATLMDAMSSRPKISEQGVVVTEAKDVVRENDIAPRREQKSEPVQKGESERVAQSKKEGSDKSEAKSADAEPVQETVDQRDEAAKSEPKSELATEGGAEVEAAQSEDENK